MPCLQPFRDDSAQLLLFKIASCLEAGGGGSGGGVTSFNGLTGPVTGVASFNGRDGVVILSQADVAAVADGRYVLKAGDTMTGPLAMPSGSAALPSNTFSGDTNTGLYSPGADSVGFSTGGTLRLTVASTAITSTVPILAPDGTAALPAFTFSADPDTGIYRIGANSFGSSAGGSVILATSTTGINLTTALAYQYNGVNVIRAQTALNNYFFGPSGNLTMTGGGNIAIGPGALIANSSGVNNVAIGLNALDVNTAGESNLAIGTNALGANLTGSNSTAVGVSALVANLASNNTAIGRDSLGSNTTSPSNTAVGMSALLNLTTAATGQNTAIGFNTGLGITTGSQNTIIGANVTGLAAGLSNNIIIADGAGVIRLQIDSSGNTTLAGTVQTAAGTAALPAFSFTGDPNTGLYNIGADSVGLSTGGTLRTTTNTTDLILATAFRLAFASGANTRAGNAVLVAGTVTVANTSVTANTIVIVTRKTSGGTIGFAVTYTVIAATSFTLTSDSASDTSTYSYLLIENP